MKGEAFEPNSTTTDNIRIIRNITEKAINGQKIIYLTYIDLRSAFDLINRKW